eukprot:313746-Amphidinium_carterae.2
MSVRYFSQAPREVVGFRAPALTKEVFGDIASGFSPVGLADESSLFPADLKLAEMPEQDHYLSDQWRSRVMMSPLCPRTLPWQRRFGNSPYERWKLHLIKKVWHNAIEQGAAKKLRLIDDLSKSGANRPLEGPLRLGIR